LAVAARFVTSSIASRLALFRTLPPRVVARRALGMVSRLAGAAGQRRRDHRQSTYGTDAPPGELVRLIETVPIAPVREAAGWVATTADLYCRHAFDLLGSGWQEVVHGMTCRGIDGVVYPPAETVTVDEAGHWLAGRINRANLTASQRIWRLVDPGYRPIDWQLDVKSCYRWRDSQWAADTPIGHLPGVDVKLPWELSRMQHLAVLAWAHALATNGEPGLQPAERYLAEFRNQVLDFIATNPPRFGVNWRCAMDVSIRAANWIVAHDLFRAFGATFDAPFSAALKASLVDHGRYIVGHLELFPEGHGNHYLADISGLCFIAAVLPRSVETDAWLAFAMQELQAETEHQFGVDGANFEGSTSYHRLAAELVVFTSAVIIGLTPDKRAAVRDAAPSALHTKPARPLRSERTDPDTAHFARIAAMAEFSRAVTKKSGLVAQIGDNDSGRFLKLHPIFTRRTPDEARRLYADLEGYRGLPEDSAYLDEVSLDHRPLIAAATSLVARADLAEFAGPGWLDASVVTALAGGRQVAAVAEPRHRASRVEDRAAPEIPPSTTLEIVAPGSSLRSGLALAGFPDFGLWIFRSDRLFLAIRCGKLGHSGRGAHDHNDQLAIELTIDGVDWVADPGSYLYTASRTMRNAYRSVQAHFAPRWERREPGRLDLGDFWLGNEARARCLRFDETGFIGEHRGFGTPVRRHITLGETSIVIADSGLPERPGEAAIRCVGHAEFVARFPVSVPFSPGYGKRYRAPAP
jgi:hypothetical protein